MNNIVFGILAHVDAGKTTFSETLLYNLNVIRKLGRVDNKDTCLDTDEIEKKRGITIYSKEVFFEIEDKNYTLLDTPGHTDFSAEMERTLMVLDYAILIVSASEGIQGHTLTLWNLLKEYNIPLFIFVNKMDQSERKKEEIIIELKKGLSNDIIDFSNDYSEEMYEEIAFSDEKLLEDFLNNKKLKDDSIKNIIANRKIFPVFFGSALKNDGVTEFFKKMQELIKTKEYGDEFFARVFKISRDEKGERLTHLRIFGGNLKVKDSINDEKVNQIRIYKRLKYNTYENLSSSFVCAVTGLNNTYAGQGIGNIKKDLDKKIEPVLLYNVNLPNGEDKRYVYQQFKILEDEHPEINVRWDEDKEEINIKIMGEIQAEIIKNIFVKRFNINILFDEGSVIYKETIRNKAYGMGHFEPLGHYAEVHLLLEEGEKDLKPIIKTELSEDILDRNYQNQILNTLNTTRLRGVLTNSELTGINITLVNGRAHNKHTEGGDFREATLRALRQGLMQAENLILEPFYNFSMYLPENSVGRALTDIEKMGGVAKICENKNNLVTLEGRAPVINIKNYQKELISYTKGFGKIVLRADGYYEAKNQKEIIENIKYNPNADINNTPDSVFCANGSGFIVKWENVKDYVHQPILIEKESKNKEESIKRPTEKEISIGNDEIENILKKTFYSNSSSKTKWKKTKGTTEIIYDNKPHRVINTAKKGIILVDGYNIIYAWRELKELALIDMEAARGRLMDILCNYQAFKGDEVIIVFDAYKVVNQDAQKLKYHNINIIYTKYAQTADAYIEKFSFDNRDAYNIRVATSDRLEKMIVEGNNALTISAESFYEEVNRISLL